MRVTLDDAPHPITDDGRRRRVIEVPDGATIEEIVEGELKSRAVDMEILVDGRELASRDGAALGDGAVITVRPRLRGGLGRIIGTLAVIAAAIFIPPLLGLAAGTLGAALAAAAITVVGGLVVNALFPPELPDVATGPNNPNPAQLFSLTGGANRARRYEPLPLILGRHRVFPDAAAVEYTENDGDEQYLNAIFNFGPGDLEVTDLRIGPNPLADFSDVEMQWSNADGEITLVAGNVDTTAGAVLADTDWVARTTGAGTTRIQVDFGGRIFQVNGQGQHQVHRVDVEVRYSKPGTPAVTNTYMLRHGDSGTYRLTEQIRLPSAGEWTVEVRRTTAVSDSERVYDEVQWTALRSYQPDDADYSGQTRLAVRIRASGQLTGRLDRLSGLVTQKLPVVPSPGFGQWGVANVATRNCAAIFVKVARGWYIDGRRVAGVGLPDERIDLAGLARWYDWCETRGYKCDLAIQGPMSRDAALRLIARRGRATLSWKTGKLGVVYEDAAATEATMITPANIVAGSFSVNWNASAPSDEIVVRYIEPGLDWEWNSIRRNRPGLTGTPQSTTTVTAQGVTDREEAAEICNLQAARQEYHPRRLAWEMGRQGRELHAGDVVWITHSLIDSGIAGRLSAVRNAVITLDRAPDGVTGGHVLLRLPDGVLHTAEVTAVSGEELTINPAPPEWPGEPEDTIYRLYPDDRPPGRARIIEAVPVSATRHRFTAIDEVAAYHTFATSDLTVQFPDPRNTAPRVVSVNFTARTVVVGDAEMILLDAALTVAGRWQGAVVRAGATVGDYRVVDRLTGTSDLTASWIIPPGTGQFVEIVPGTVDSPDGPVWTGEWTWRGVSPPPPDVTNFRITELADNTRRFQFDFPTRDDLGGIEIGYRVRIRYHATVGTAFAEMTPLHDGLVTVSPYDNIDPGEGTWEFAAVAVNSEGVESAPRRVTKALGPMRDRGSTWHFGNNDPAAELGQDGDFYYDKTDRAIWQKISGAWTEQASVLGADGSTWLTGAAAPRASQGKDGDYYFRTGSAAVAGSVYRKAAGAWTKLVDIDDGIDGATWHSGEGVPGVDVGEVGDWFFRTDNGYVYQKTGAMTWAFRRDITGPAGASWLEGAGDPAAGDGRFGDFYLRTSDGAVFEKKYTAQFTGADGGTWHRFNAVTPSNSVGADGDWGFRTGGDSQRGTIYKRVSGAWTIVKRLTDAGAGEDWWAGERAPAGSVGNAGDWHFKWMDGTVREKVAATAWLLRRDETGPVWIQIASLAAADGAEWHHGATAPANSRGKDGDFYFQTGSATAAGTIYVKASGSWSKLVDIDQGTRGVVWHGGTTAPAAGLGEIGDWYYRTSNGFVYVKTGVSTWTFRRDQTGPKGDKGDRGPSGPRVWTRLWTGSGPTARWGANANRDGRMLNLSRRAGDFDLLAVFGYGERDDVLTYLRAGGFGFVEVSSSTRRCIVPGNPPAEVNISGLSTTLLVKPSGQSFHLREIWGIETP